MIDVIILAAGKGTRFGSKQPKCLSAIDNQSIISRIINQVSKYVPNSKIKIILGYNPEPIIQHTSGYGVSYVVNDKFMSDKNIRSVFLGIEDSKNGALILEGDCVYDDTTFREISLSLGNDSVIFLGDKANVNRTNGVIKVKDGKFEKFLIGDKNGQELNNYFDMAGALWVSKRDLSTFRKEIIVFTKDSLDFYYFVPLFNKSKFNLRCKVLLGSRYTFNTQQEYKNMVASFMTIGYFSVKNLKHIEGFSGKRVEWLKDKITKEKIWTRPVCVDPSGLVMDGQHRMEVSRALGLKKIPAIIFDYNDVSIYSLRDNYEVSVEEIRERVKNDNVYPYKTVKHKFPIEIKDCNISLDYLHEL